MQARVVVFKRKAKVQELLLELPAIVGRNRTAAVAIDHPVVSRQHCEIFESGGSVRVRDLGSTNGTRVGDKKIKEAVLRPRDRFSIGPFTFVVHYAPREDATAGQADELAEAVPDFGPGERSLTEGLPSGRGAPDDDLKLADETGLRNDGLEIAAPARGTPGASPDVEAEAAATLREVPKQRAADAAPAAMSRADLDFDELLDDFFDALQGQDLREFLKGLQ